jgi:hypothetical protein
MHEYLAAATKTEAPKDPGPMNGEPGTLPAAFPFYAAKGR